MKFNASASVLVILAAAAAASAQQSPAAVDDFTFTLAGGHLAGRGYPRPTTRTARSSGRSARAGS